MIQGGEVASPEWLDLPRVIRARHPDDQAKFTRVRVNVEDTIKAAQIRRRQPAYEFWSVLAAKAPPVPGGVDVEGLTSLTDAVACFRGIKRPIGSDGEGGQVLAYVLRPSWVYAFEPRPPIAFSVKRRVPDGLVFVAYVCLDEPDGEGTIGVLSHWHFVYADPQNPNLPSDFANRYFTRLW